MKPNILIIMKVLVHSGIAMAIVARASTRNLRQLPPLAPRRAVVLSLFRRRQPMSRHKEAFVSRLRDALRE